MPIGRLGHILCTSKMASFVGLFQPVPPSPYTTSPISTGRKNDGAAEVALPTCQIHAGNASASRVPKDRIRTEPPASRLVATTNVRQRSVLGSFSSVNGLWPPIGAVATTFLISCSRNLSSNAALGSFDVLVKTFSERVLYLKMASSTDYESVVKRHRIPS